MERVQSLINKLNEQYREGQGPKDLLQTLEQMRNELLRAIPPVDHVRAPVTVMLPPGYQPTRTTQPVPPPAPTTANDRLPPQSPVMPLRVPRPPAVAVVSEDIASPANKSAAKEVEPESVLATQATQGLQQVPYQKDGTASNHSRSEKGPNWQPLPMQNPDENTVNPVSAILKAGEQGADLNDASSRKVVHDQLLVAQNEQEESIRERLVGSTGDKPLKAPEIFELKLDEEDVADDLPAASPVSALPTEIAHEFLQGQVAAVPPVAKPRELHELLASRVVATSEPRAKQWHLADKLAHSKLTDLRKGFGINDRYRYITSLFRGDEDMFERAVKTINNFAVLQEAEYWIKRELVIKLGWNEEDELVQQFFQLVNRRFL